MTTNKSLNIGRQIRIRRLALELRPQDLAEKLGISVAELERYESEPTRIPAARLLEIAKLLDAPLTYFFSDDAVATERPAPTGFGELGPEFSSTELARLVWAFESIADVTGRMSVVELAEALARTKSH